MSRVLRLVCSLATVAPAAPSLLAAQETAPAAAPKACAAPEHRQFDFWIGEWEVTTPNGAPAGRNRIESILDGCALRESWTGAKGRRVEAPRRASGSQHSGSERCAEARPLIGEVWKWNCCYSPECP